MAESCAHIEALNKKANCSKHKESEDNVLAAAPETKIKLYMNHVDVNALNNLQLCDLQFSKYQKLEKDNGTKLALVELLKANIADNPGSLAVSPRSTGTITDYTRTLLV